jgi:hypothetical protein
MKYAVDMEYGGIIKFHDDPFSHSSTIKIIASKIWEAAMLVLLMGGIYEVCRCDNNWLHDIHPKFHENLYRRSSNIKVLLK